MVWPAVIAAGAAIAGGLLSKSGSTSTGWNKQVYADQKVREDSRFQRSVADAKAAGLHPLFALGTAGSYGGGAGGFVGGGGGSAAGAGIARAGEHIATGMRQAKAGERTEVLDAASRQIHDLRIQKMGREIALDDAELMKRASDLKMAENQLLYWGDGGTGLSTGGLESRAYPYGTKRGPPLSMRPLIATARQSMPETVESVGRGGEYLQLLNPDLGLDEVGQAEYLRLKAAGYGTRALMRGYKSIRKRHKKQRRRSRRIQRRSDADFYGGS